MRKRATAHKRMIKRQQGKVKSALYAQYQAEQEQAVTGTFRRMTLHQPDHNAALVRDLQAQVNEGHAAQQAMAQTVYMVQRDRRGSFGEQATANSPKIQGVHSGSVPSPNQGSPKLGVFCDQISNGRCRLLGFSAGTMIRFASLVPKSTENPGILAGHDKSKKVATLGFTQFSPG